MSRERSSARKTRVNKILEKDKLRKPKKNSENTRNTKVDLMEVGCKNGKIMEHD
jgi:hypothetical protein